MGRWFRTPPGIWIFWLRTGSSSPTDTIRVMESDEARIENVFSFHPAADQSVAQRHEHVREALKLTAVALVALVPECQERDVALDKLREAMMWANAGIACN